MRPEDLWPDGPYAKKIEEKIHKDLRKAYLAQEIKNTEGFLYLCSMQIQEDQLLSTPDKKC
jgi:hypothetical protein